MEKIDKFKSRNDWFIHAWLKFLKDIKNPDAADALNSLLSSREKIMIINRMAAMVLIREGKTYRQIGEELWVSPTTVRSLKRTLENNLKEYQSYRLLRNKRNKKEEAENAAKRKEIIETPDWVNRVDYWLSTFPKKNGPRWKWYKPSHFK